MLQGPGGRPGQAWAAPPRSSGPLPHRPAPLGSFPGTPHGLDPTDSPAGPPPAGPQKSLPSADLMILNSAWPPITWGTLPPQLGPGLIPVGLEKCGLPSASSEIGSASRVVWGHRGGSTLGETPLRQVQLRSICAHTPFPGRAWRRGQPLAGRGGNEAVTGND